MIHLETTKMLGFTPIYLLLCKFKEIYIQSIRIWNKIFILKPKSIIVTCFYIIFSLLPQLSIAKMDPMSQVFCLRWNNHRNNLLTVFDQLLQTEAFCDVTLACDNNSIKCHKMILSACSSYFQQLFMENTCEHPIVFLKDIKYEEIRTILDYMYKGEVNVAQEELPGKIFLFSYWIRTRE